MGAHQPHCQPPVSALTPRKGRVTPLWTQRRPPREHRVGRVRGCLSPANPPQEEEQGLCQSPSN